MIPAAIAAVTQVGTRIAASSIGKALIGTPLRALFTGLGIGQVISSRAPQAQAQVQQNRS